jgi:hypothetical protein
VANQQRRADVTLADAFPGFDGAREVATDAGRDPADVAGAAAQRSRRNDAGLSSFLFSVFSFHFFFGRDACEAPG